MKEFVRKNDLGEKVKFFGMVEEKKLHELYQLSDAFVLYSDWEGFGLVVVEAMAAGDPAIVSNRGSLPFLVRNGFNGFVVKNDRELREKIRLIMEEDSLRSKLSENAIRFSKKFSWDEITKKHESKYLEAIKDG